MAHARLIATHAAGVLLAGVLLGCNRAAPPATAKVASKPEPVSPAEPVGIADRNWDTVFSARYSLSLALPERQTWQIDDAREPWFTARQASSRSELMLKAWRAPRLVSIEDCRAQVRLWQPKAPDPQAMPESVVDRRPIEAPRGYETELVVGVRRSAAAAEIEGYVLATGRAIGSCFAGIYTTRARGRGAEEIVGERLALVSDTIFPRIEKRSIEDRVK